VRVDTTAPHSTASATASGLSGWNTADVTVTIAATDGGSGVARIVYDTGGSSTSVAGGSATVDIHADGPTTVTYHAVDGAGNAGPAKTLTVKIDKTKPGVSCGTADGDWHGTNVSIACTTADATSGLAHAEDASFSLSTSVAAGVTNGNASTDTRTVCDVAGNCTPAGPVAG